MAGEWSEGRYRECRGGLHWLSEVDPMFGSMSRQGVQVCTMIATRVFVGQDTTVTLPIGEIKRRLGCKDKRTKRCKIWETGSAELRELGLLEDADEPDQYRVVMPESVTQNVTKVTQNVNSVTWNDTEVTQNVTKVTQNDTCIKEVERESILEGENTQSACAREAADRCFAKYPDNRRTNPHNFARLFEVAVQAWGVRYDVDRDTAIGQVEAQTMAHIDSHRRARREDRYFPSPKRFFDEHVDNKPETQKPSPAEEREAHAKRLLAILEARS